jgi:hypothetical protein
MLACDAAHFEAKQIGDLLVSPGPEKLASGDTALSNTSADISVVGRQDELEVLGEALKNTAESRGQVVVLAGEAGIGKTFLLSHTKHSAEQLGFRVASATCSNLSGAPPLWPWEVALGQDAELAEALELLAQLRSEIAKDDEVDAAAARRFELFSSITKVILGNPDSAPLMIAIDDMHWADTTSKTCSRSSHPRYQWGRSLSSVARAPLNPVLQRA